MPSPPFDTEVGAGNGVGAGIAIVEYTTSGEGEIVLCNKSLWMKTDQSRLTMKLVPP